MNIFHHLIKTSEIIGIGPLYAQPSRDQAMVTLYNAQRFSFEVHTKTRSIEIVSEYFRPGSTDFPNPDPKERERYDKWEQDYYRHRTAIGELLGEPATT